MIECVLDNLKNTCIFILHMLNIYFKHIIIIENIATMYFVFFYKFYYILLSNNIKYILNIYYTMIYILIYEDIFNIEKVRMKKT